VPLHFLLFYEGQSTRWFDPEENYQTGYVFKELPQSWRKPGDYTGQVRLQRHKVASTEFRIAPQIAYPLGKAILDDRLTVTHGLTESATH